MDKGYMFIWDPREQVPYLVPPSVVLNCKLRIFRKHRICASHVVEYVPQYDEEVTPVDFIPPDRLQPMGAVDASPAVMKIPYFQTGSYPHPVWRMMLLANPWI